MIQSRQPLATAPFRRRVLVSGADGGLGGAIVAHLLECDCSVAACDRVAPTISLPTVGRVSPHGFDLADWNATGDGVVAAIDELGGCDAVIANAAVIDTLRRASRFGEEEWRHDLDVNLSGAFRFVQAAYPALRESGDGRVVFISSVSAVLGQPGQAAYAASKAGLVGAMRTLSVEWAADGIKCNVVMPGMIETPKVADLSPAVRSSYVDAVPLGRFGRPEELAGTVVFLLSPAAAYITGAMIRVDGGFGLTRMSLATRSRSSG